MTKRKPANPAAAAPGTNFMLGHSSFNGRNLECGPGGEDRCSL